MNLEHETSERLQREVPSAAEQVRLYVLDR